MLCCRCRFHRFVVVVVVVIIVVVVVVAIAVVIVVVVVVVVAQKCKTAPVQRDAGSSATSWILVIDPKFQHDSIFWIVVVVVSVMVSLLQALKNSLLPSIGVSKVDYLDSLGYPDSLAGIVAKA